MFPVWLINDYLIKDPVREEFYVDRLTAVQACCMAKLEPRRKKGAGNILRGVGRNLMRSLQLLLRA